MYLLLNLMSNEGVPAAMIMSVLGYCLLPMVLLSAVSVVISLQLVREERERNERGREGVRYVLIEIFKLGSTVYTLITCSSHDDHMIYMSP